MPMNPRSLLLSGLLAASLCCLCGAALAHEGHHEAEPDADSAPAAQAPAAPRSALDTPQIELVVQREGRDLVLYLDDYATNAPLNGLQVAVRSNTLTLQAAPNGEGTYRVPGDLIDQPGGEPLQIEVHGAGIDAHLQAPLPAAADADHAAPAEAPAQVPAPVPEYSSPRIAAALLAVLLAIGAAWLLLRRRQGRAARRLGAA